MDSERYERYLPVLAVAVGLSLLIALAGPCEPEPNVNDELARTARTAVEAVDRAQRGNDAAYLWPGRLRLAAVALGVTIPVAAAVILVWLVTRQRPGDAELLKQLHEHGLLLNDRSSRSLAGPEPRPELASDKKSDGSSSATKEHSTAIEEMTEADSSH